MSANTDSERMAVRLTPDDALQLRILVDNTAARNKSEVIRHALQTLRHCWTIKTHSDRLEIWSKAKHRLEYLFLLEPRIGESDEERRHSKYRNTLQLRLTPHDRQLLQWLRDQGVADTDSAVIRSAIGLLHDLYQYHSRGCALFARVGTQVTAVDIPLLEEDSVSLGTSGSNPRHDDQESRDLPALTPGEVISFKEVRDLHVLYPWKSVLIKIDTLYDDDAFLSVVEKHLRYGTKLFYVLTSEETLDGLWTKLRGRAERLDLKWKQFVRVLKVEDKQDFAELDEFVVFNFLEDSNVTGFIWDANHKCGTIASRKDLETLAREFRGKAEELENQDALILQEFPNDRALTAVVRR